MNFGFATGNKYKPSLPEGFFHVLFVAGIYETENQKTNGYLGIRTGTLNYTLGSRNRNWIWKFTEAKAYPPPEAACAHRITARSWADHKAETALPCGIPDAALPLVAGTYICTALQTAAAEQQRGQHTVRTGTHGIGVRHDAVALVQGARYAL